MSQPRAAPEDTAPPAESFGYEGDALRLVRRAGDDVEPIDFSPLAADDLDKADQ